MNTSKTKRKMRNLVALLLLFSLIVARISVADEGFHELIESGVLPVMQRSTGSSLTEEDWKDIRSVMEESGRSIPESVVSAPSHSKDGVLRVLISAELGGTLGEWPVEEQAWYADMLVSLGLWDVSELRVPQDGEITREQAVQLAAEYLRQTLGTDAPFEDQEKFLCIAQYVADTTWRARWYIEFSSRDSEEGTWFQVQLSPYGEIDEAGSGLGVDQEESDERKANEEAGNTAQRSIEQEEAVEIAWDAIKTEYGLDDEDRDRYEVWASLVENTGRELWNISFHHNEKDTYGVRIEKKTGKIVDICDAGDGVG